MLKLLVKQKGSVRRPMEIRRYIERNNNNKNISNIIQKKYKEDHQEYKGKLKEAIKLSEIRLKKES